MQLNDGTPHAIKRCGASDGVLWIVLYDMTIMDAAVIFSDPAKTSHITAFNDFIYDNYTELIHISLDYDGLVKVALRKEA
jgi:hypothetical protein